MKKFAVIVAGGSGTRMCTDTPKQFLLLHNKPILWYSINAFLNAYSDINIIVVLPQEHVQKGEEIKQSFETITSSITLVVGGATRFHSVQNGLKYVEPDSVVFIHDAVRCLLTRDLIETCCQQAIEKGSAIPAVTATDSIRIAQNNEHKIMDRNQVYIVQTPQTFLSNIVLKAFEQPYSETFTDEATVVEATGTQVHLCKGNYNNIKITRPIDLFIAEKLMVE